MQYGWYCAGEKHVLSFSRKKTLNIQSLKDLEATSKECIVQGIKNPWWNVQGHIVQGYIVPFSTTKSKVMLIKNCSPKLFYNMPYSFPEITFWVRPLRTTSCQDVLLYSLPPSLGTGLIGPGIWSTPVWRPFSSLSRHLLPR